MLKEFADSVIFDEPLARHTSFKIGGPADAFACPPSESELLRLLTVARAGGMPVFVIGAGANILVRDHGIRGLVVSLEKLNGFTHAGTTLEAGAGCQISLLAEVSARAGYAGLERFFAMPGSVGGSVWMNARCYDRSIAEVIVGVRVAETDSAGRYTIRERKVCQEEFGYKRSPFQGSADIILKAHFRLTEGDRQHLAALMDEIKHDREAKGHFSAPSAGSVYKNDRRFGMPTGQLIDALGLKGARVGDAELSPQHANIIINRGRARAEEIIELMELIEEKVHAAYGFSLERELLVIGE